DRLQLGREPVARHAASGQNRDQDALRIHPPRRNSIEWTSAASILAGHTPRRFTMSRSSRFVQTAALLCALFFALPLGAQTKSAEDEEGPVRRWGADAKAYVTAPLHAERKQWVKFGSTVAAIAFAYHQDDDIRAHFVPEGTPLSTTHDSHSAQDAL